MLTSERLARPKSDYKQGELGAGLSGLRFPEHSFSIYKNDKLQHLH